MFFIWRKFQQLRAYINRVGRKPSPFRATLSTTKALFYSPPLGKYPEGKTPKACLGDLILAGQKEELRALNILANPAFIKGERYLPEASLGMEYKQNDKNCDQRTAYWDFIHYLHYKAEQKGLGHNDRSLGALESLVAPLLDIELEQNKGNKNEIFRGNTFAKYLIIYLLDKHLLTRNKGIFSRPHSPDRPKKTKTRISKPTRRTSYSSPLTELLTKVAQTLLTHFEKSKEPRVAVQNCLNKMFANTMYSDGLENFDQPFSFTVNLSTRQKQFEAKAVVGDRAR